MGIRQISIRLDEEVLAEAEKIAVAEGITQAQVLRRSLRDKLLGGGLIQITPAPQVPDEALLEVQRLMDATEAELGVREVVDVVRIREGLAREPRYVTAADAMASVRPEVRAAKAIAKIQKKSSGAAVFVGADLGIGSDRTVATAMRGGVIVGERELRDGVPCGHPGCLSHISHPCEGCGRVGGRSTDDWVAHKAVEDGANVGAAGSPVEEAPSCPECFKYLVAKKGKWRCATVGCAMFDMEQR